MRIVRTILICSVGLGALGCFSSPRPRAPASPNSATTKPTGQANDQKPFWARPDNPRPLSIPGESAGIRPTAAEQSDYNGVLAGSLVDTYNRAVPRGYIQVAVADGSGARPVELAVENGFFSVPGLTPGRAYMLTARTVDGERKLAGRIQAIPPNARVIIRVSEDLYSGTVPPPPGLGDGLGASGTSAPRMGRPIPDPFAAPAPPLSTGGPDKARFDDSGGWKPDGAPGRGTGVNGDPPAPPLDSPPLDRDRIPPPAFNPENIAGDKDKPIDPRRSPAPIINLPGGPAEPPLPAPDPTPMGGPRPANSPGAFHVPGGQHVPFCEFNGPNRVRNFALVDVLSGQPWEFRQRQGRLVLLDFWGTWCGPCVRAIPHVKKLQADYGRDGLEVVGIACERGNESGRARKVVDAIDKYQITYRVLLGEEYEECPVQQKFGIKYYPTMILLDAGGQILWRGDATKLAELDALLRRELRGGK